MKRRSLLKALPAAVVAGAAPAAALCVVDPAETPVMRLFREWEVARDREIQLNNDLRLGDAEDALVDAAGDYRHEIEVRMLAEPSQSGKDILAKIAAWTFYGEFTFDGGDERLVPVWDEIRALVA